MSLDEEISILWSKLPTQHSDVDCITLDSPPVSPPEDLAKSQPSTSTGHQLPSLLTLNVMEPPPMLPTHLQSMLVPLETSVVQLDTPEDSGQEQNNKEAPAAGSKKKKKRKKKKKSPQPNPVLLEKMVEQIKESGVLEKNRERTVSEESGTRAPTVKWQRYFEASPSEVEAGTYRRTEERPPSARELKKIRDRQERMARVQRGKVSKLSRGSRGSRMGGKRIRCLNCSQWGHMKFECPDPIKQTKCHMCAGVGHTSDNCPKSSCLKCGKQSYTYSYACKSCRNTGYLNCSRCHCQGHEARNCPELWRRFHSTVSGDGSQVSKSTKLGPSSLKMSHRLYCSGCARRGHSIDSCNYSGDIINSVGYSFVSSKLDAADFGKNECKRPDMYEDVRIQKRFKQDLYG